MSNDSSAFFVNPGEEWDRILDFFSQFNLDDIYFDYRYLNLYLSPNSEDVAEAFVFKHDKDILFLPYIRKPINKNKKYWDFETAYGYSGPISSSDNSTFINSAWNNFVDLAKEKKIIAGLIRFNPLINNHKFCQSNSVKIINERETVWLDCLRSQESIFGDYSKKHFKQISSIESKGVHVRCSNLESSLKKFCEIYLSRMAALGAGQDYLFGSNYFNKVFLLGQDKWKVYLAYSPKKEIIGGCLLLFSKRFCHYHLSGSLAQFLKYKPNDILRHTVIKDMIKFGIEKIHFGGGRTSNPEDSLLKFKLKFSKQTTMYRLGYCTIDKLNYDIICKNWEERFPEKKDYKDYFLKYRY